MTRDPCDAGAATPPADVEAFVGLVARHQRRLYLLILSLVGHPPDADDVLQETHMVLWREFRRFEPGSNFAAWSSAVAFNQVLAWRKRRQRDRLVFSDEFLAAVAAELTESADRLDRRSGALAGCLERLPAPARELVRRRYMEGLGVDAIASQTGRTADAVYRALSRARRLLHDCVGATLARGVGRE